LANYQGSTGQKAISTNVQKYTIIHGTLHDGDSLFDNSTNSTARRLLSAAPHAPGARTPEYVSTDLKLLRKNRRGNLAQ
jgi:hypothetical protein